MVVGAGKCFYTVLLGGARVRQGVVFVLADLFVNVDALFTRNALTAKTRHARRCLPLLGKGQMKVMIGRASVINRRRAYLLSALLRLGVGMIGIFTPRRNFHNGTSTNRAVGSKGSDQAKVPLVSLCKGGGGPAVRRLRSVSVVVFSVRSIKTQFCACVDAVFCMVRTYTRGKGRVVMLSQPGPYSCVSKPVLHPTFHDFMNVLPVPVLRNYAVNRLTLVVGNRK